ncbi:MAG: DNA polymerase IV [Eubacteriales bacterium]|nr:DNA polymerase IV [Eubacteriales bacterium]
MRVGRTRTIFHIDMNAYYASVELLHRPELRGEAMAVGGEKSERHGIILAKNALAKSYGVSTGEALWEAEQKCPGLRIVPPNYRLYREFSKRAHQIYLNYSDRVESFGLDECWIDVSDQTVPAYRLALKLKEEVYACLGIAASIGIASNKIFAKLASDLAAADGIYMISDEAPLAQIAHCAVEDLLYVGPRTKRKLAKLGIERIVDLARIDPQFMQRFLGLHGRMISDFARGLDCSPVRSYESHELLKSIGNSMTSPVDLRSESEIRAFLLPLCESVAARLREQNFYTTLIQVSLRSDDLRHFAVSKRCEATQTSQDIFEFAWTLYCEHYHWNLPLRSMGIRASGLCAATGSSQVLMPVERARAWERSQIDHCFDEIRRRYGYAALQRAICLQSPLAHYDIQHENCIHPSSYLKAGERMC